MLGTGNPRHRTAVAESRRRTRRGAILILAAVFMVVMMGLLALSVDVGYVMNVRSELKRATDAAALAGAGTLIEGSEVAQLQSLDFLLRNPVGSQVLLEEENREALLEAWLAEHPDEFQVAVGHWDPDTRTFSQSDYLPSTIQVIARRSHVPLFFARIFGRDDFDVQAESIARYQPRDIALVLDFSASMNDDSELRRIYEFGESSRAAVEQSLLEIYQDLGSPTYGNMQFEPQYISSTSTYTIKNTLGLNGVAYPYPSGSWDSYISYVQSSSYLYRAGYRKKYGYLTLINYWLEQKPKYSQTPDLWAVSAQPVATVKDAVGVFMTYIQEVDCDDRVALAVYNSPSQNALLEQALTEDFAAIENIVQHRQAGHYDRYTNIGAGIHEAWLELDNNGRPGAKKMIVLMTDGIANRPGGTSSGQAYALEQAQMAADRHYPIVTISLGNAADTSLMQQIADISNGVHFNVPGGESVTDYEDDLLAVFRQIADDRPLMLVK